MPAPFRIFIPDTEASERMKLATRLAALPNVAVRTGADFSTSEERMLRDVEDADVLCVALARVSASVIAAAPNLRMVVKCGIGTDNIDLEAARSRGISVVRTAGVNFRGVAEYVIGAVIVHFRRVLELNSAIRTDDWTPLRQKWAGRVESLQGRVIGVVGAGAIGREVVRLALAHGMRALVHDPHVPESALRELGVEPVGLEQLLADSDVVTLHALLTPETTHLISTDQLRAMQPHAILINTSRGPVVDEKALVLALDQGAIGGAVLDVFETEPLPSNSPLRSLPNCILSPHLAGCTDGGYAEIGERAAELVELFLNGRPLISGCVVVP